jgi:hypothetical protein
MYKGIITQYCMKHSQNVPHSVEVPSNKVQGVLADEWNAILVHKIYRAAYALNGGKHGTRYIQLRGVGSRPYKETEASKQWNEKVALCMPQKHKMAWRSVWLHSLPTVALYQGGWLPSCPGRFASQKSTSSSQGTGYWMSLRAGLDTLEKTQISFTCRESNNSSVVLPVPTL